MQRALKSTVLTPLLLLTVWFATVRPARADLFLNEERRYNRTAFLNRMKEVGFTVTDEEKTQAEISARQFVYPLTDKQVQENSERKKLFIDRTYKYYPQYYTEQANGFLDQIFGKKYKNDALRQEFCRQMTIALDQVLSNRQQPFVAQANCGMILAHLATRSERPETIELLIRLLTPQKDPLGKLVERNDGVKLYAFRGLRNVLAQPKSPVKEKQRGQIAQILIHEITRKPAPFVAVSPREDRVVLEGFRYLRREAIKALAEIETPSLKGPDGKKLTPAVTLLGIVEGQWQDNTPVTPAPRGDELVEAMLGVLKMKKSLDPTWQPEYAVFPVASMMLRSLVPGYRFELSRGTSKRFPYKIYAVRIQAALEEFAKDNKLKKLRDKQYDATANPVLGVFVNESLNLMGFIVRGDARPFDTPLQQWYQKYAGQRPKAPFRTVQQP